MEGKILLYINGLWSDRGLGAMSQVLENKRFEPQGQSACREALYMFSLCSFQWPGEGRRPRARPRRRGPGAGTGLDSIPDISYKRPSVYGTLAQVAQLVEHVTENHGVGGSIPPLGTIVSMG